MGDCKFAALLESKVGERFRVANSGDITPHVPPRDEEMVDEGSVLNAFIKGLDELADEKLQTMKDYLSLAGTTLRSPLLLLASNGISKVQDVAPSFAPLLGLLPEKFCHHGVYIATLDYIDPAGTPVQKEIRCVESDVDR